MTKAISATQSGLKPHYKVRVVFHGAIVHLAAWNEPDIHLDEWTDDKISNVKADWIVGDGRYGDTPGFIDWKAVTAVTWRWSE
jgi:hypothetical protein